MRNANGLATWVVRYFEEHPLTKRERLFGRAVRAVSCVRANDEDMGHDPSAFIWSVVVARNRARTQRDVPLCVHPLSRVLGPGNQCVAVERVARAELVLDDEAWGFEEYAASVPFAIRDLVFAAGMALCHVGRRRCFREQAAYYGRICNAAADREGYARWFERHRAKLAALDVPQTDMLVSIVCPVFRTRPEHLRAMLTSIVSQTYAHWELVIVNASPDDAGVASVLAEFNDERIRVVDCPENEGIAGNTNVGIACCNGAYVCFLDHDDTVEPQALAAMVDAIKRGGEAVDLLYCDEDSIDEQGCYCVPLFKPGCNPDLLGSNNYVIHWLMVSRRALGETTRSDVHVDGAQDYDLTFKVLELGRAAVHVPYVLYHWRIHEGSMNANADSKQYAQESGRRAIANHLERLGIDACVTRESVPSTYRIDYAPPAHLPDIACISLGEPTRSLLDACEVYRNRGGRIRLDVAPTDTSASEVADRVMGCAEPLLLIIGGGLLVEAGMLESLVGYFERPEVFAVSPRVLFSNGLVDYAGCIVRPDAGLCKLGHLLPEFDGGYIGRLHRPYSAAVLSTDCCMARTDLLREVSFGAGYETVAFSLADACLTAYERGMANVYTPFVTARWQGARSLLSDAVLMDSRDQTQLMRRWAPTISRGDPSHNPNFDPFSPYYRLS